MNAQELKKKIYEENLVKELLEKIGMHHIKSHSQEEYFTCGMPDGDNTVSTTVYNDENLGVVAYTRGSEIKDIISLVEYTQNLNFRQALDWICQKLQLQNDVDLFSNKSILIMPSADFISKLEKQKELEEKGEITMYDDRCLNIYDSCCYAVYSPYFLKDNISEKTQQLFEVIPHLYWQKISWNWTYYNEYDVIPIRDEIGILVGIKARQYGSGKNSKYFYLKSCDKSKNLYGLYITKDFINSKNEVIICEAEKGVMQLWTYGYKNVVAVGGHNISRFQAEKIAKLGVDKVVIAFDKDVDEILLYEEYKKLKDLVTEVTCIIDKQHILNEKESPMDNPKNWEKLYKEYQFVPKLWSDDYED